MRDILPRQPHSVECGIVNLNTSSQPGRHWVRYYRNNSDRIHFDSYGQITPVEIQRYLKTGIEFARSKEVIQRNTDIVQAANIPVCGRLFILKSLASVEKFQTILIICNTMWVNVHKVIGKMPFKPKRGFVLPKHHYNGPYKRLENQNVTVKC